MTNQTTANHVTHNAVLRRTANWRNLYFIKKRIHYTRSLTSFVSDFCQSTAIAQWTRWCSPRGAANRIL